MRIAVLADVHGNADALRAILGELSREPHLERILVLGDLVAFGPDAVAVSEQLRSTPTVSCLLGNCDRGVAFGEHPLPHQESRTDDTVRGYLWLARCCGWTAGQLAASGHLDWLAKLPRELRLELPNGRRLLAVHGSPASDEEGMGDGSDADRLRELVRLAQTDLVLAGHTHRAYSTVVDGVEVHTVASVSSPKGADKSANYSVLETTGLESKLERRSVAYDYRSTVARAQAMCHPAAEHLARAFGLW